MINQIFLNLPVADLQRSISFFKALGFVHNPQFSDDTAACIVISDAISVMLGTHAKFREFTPKAVCDTSQAVEVLISLSCESRKQVDELVAKALAAGGSTSTSRRISGSCTTQLRRPGWPWVGAAPHGFPACTTVI